MPEGLDTVYFGNSGAEVVDGALKLARRATGRSHIIAFSGAFHGRTYGAISVTTSSLNYRTGYDPLLPDVHIAPFPYAYRDFGGDEEAASASALDHLERLFATIVPPSRTAAFIIEPVQGEGGYVPAPASFLRGLRELADRHGILLIADEVQSGYGRTGRMWAFEHAGIVPDIVLSAKAIANGMPLAALISSRELQQRWGVGAHGSTYGGNPVSCAAGIAVLEVMREEGLVANAAARGAELTRGLQALASEDPRIGDVRGPGPHDRRRAGQGPRDARAGRRAGRGPHGRLRGPRAAAAHLRPQPQHHALDPAPGRQPRRGRGEPGHLPGGPARDRLTAARPAEPERSAQSGRTSWQGFSSRPMPSISTVMTSPSCIDDLGVAVPAHAGRGARGDDVARLQREGT